MSSIALFGAILFLNSTIRAQSSFQEIYQSYLNGEVSVSEAAHLQLDHFIHHHDHSDHDITKCLTPLMILIDRQNDENAHQLLKKLELISPPSVSTASAEFLSPSGKFRINYQTTGSDAVPLDDLNNNSIPDYVEEVAEASDFSYQHEIVTLGFTDPIGPSEVYDVFIEDLSAFGAYGLTNNRTIGSFPCNSTGPRTCIYIENDFAGFPPNTDPEGNMIGSIKVTMAHEFKHAIQYAQNNWTGDSDRWAEMDATLMEEVVYDDVNDYYNYISGFSTDLFSRASTSLIPGSYEDITWALYFHEKFGETFWTDVWKTLESDNSFSLLEAVEFELTSQNISYEGEALESYMWHFASGSSFSGSNFGFDERLSYPGPGITTIFDELQSELTNSISLSRFSARYYLADPIGNPDDFVKLNFESDSENLHFGLIGYRNDGSIETQSAIGNSSRLSGSIETTWAWSDLDKVGFVVMNSSAATSASYSFQFTNYDLANEIELAQNYPNPFNPKTTIRVTIPQRQNITLDVFDILGRHIHTIYTGPVDAGFPEFTFDATSLSSGIYIYRLTTSAGQELKKMTLIK